jgi:hypothetical protein
MDASDANPFLNANLFDGSSSTSFDDAGSLSDVIIQHPSHTVLQMVNIHHTHVPVKLSLSESNYTEWKSFFDAFIGKFGLTSHLTSAPTINDRHDPEWAMVDQCIISWLYNSVSKDVRALVRAPKTTAYKIWKAIHT